MIGRKYPQDESSRRPASNMTQATPFDDDTQNGPTLSDSVQTVAFGVEPPTPTDSPTDSPRERQRSIRFRPRVRITSGIHRNKRVMSSQAVASASTSPSIIPLDRSASENDVSALTIPRRISQTFTERHPSFSGSSSLSTSPSSSISAPLRSSSHSRSCSRSPGKSGFEGETTTTKRKSSRRWAPLGRRISSGVVANRGRGAAPRMSNAFDGDTASAPLLHPRSYQGSRYDGYDSTAGSRYDHRWEYDDDDSAEEARMNEEIDKVFGTWPGRLLNRRWWWWQLEPVMCCICSDEYN